MGSERCCRISAPNGSPPPRGVAWPAPFNTIQTIKHTDEEEHIYQLATKHAHSPAWHDANLAAVHYIWILISAN